MTTEETIRLLIHDTSAVVSEQFFTPAQITEFYTLGGDVFNAASLALYSMLANQTQIAKAVRIGSWSTDSSSTMEKILELARTYASKSKASIRSLIAEMRPHHCDIRYLYTDHHEGWEYDYPYWDWSDNYDDYH